jgi:hypothetical protein
MIPDNKLHELITRAGFSNTYERVRLERLVWLTALEISPLLDAEKWELIKELLSLPEDVQQRKNFNYLLKTRQDQPEDYMK